ncbi:RDD family protein [Liberiplasma polymorphum]|jgi:hypothetical protein|uniref:RDD family protein n=1 Tax=Liberiplasma polymorphum TaxID=3374570 RepID=UPI0037727BF6
MNAGFIRRSLAFVADFIVIMSITVVSFQLIGRPLFASRVDTDAFERIPELQIQYREELITIEDNYYDNIINEEEYNEQKEALAEYYYETYPVEWNLRDDYINYSVFYFVIAFLVINALYMIITKGHSVGRKLVKLKLSGNVTILSILLREIFWKYVFWGLTLGIGLFIDMYMIILTHNRKTLRDHFSKTRVILDDIVYPF